MTAGRHLEKNGQKLITLAVGDSIWEADAEWHAHDENDIKIETGSRIPIFQYDDLPFFENGSSYISTVDLDI